MWLPWAPPSSPAPKQHANESDRVKATYEHANTDDIFSLWFKSNTKWQLYVFFFCLFKVKQLGNERLTKCIIIWEPEL